MGSAVCRVSRERCKEKWEWGAAAGALHVPGKRGSEASWGQSKNQRCCVCVWWRNYVRATWRRLSALFSQVCEWQCFVVVQCLFLDFCVVDCMELHIDCGNLYVQNFQGLLYGLCPLFVPQKFLWKIITASDTICALLLCNIAVMLLILNLALLNLLPAVLLEHLQWCSVCDPAH